jgi:hypothetical protein
MTSTARIGSVSFLVLAAIFAASPATAGTMNKADADVCAELLQDLATWRKDAIELGCDVPSEGEPSSIASAEPEFPPVVMNQAEAPMEPVAQAEAPADEFPPVVASAPVKTAQSEFPPVQQATAEPESAPASFPPVETASTGSVEDDAFADEGPVRTAIREKLEEFKEEARARVQEAISLKAEEVKERVKEKIKHKLEEVIVRHRDHDDGEHSFRSKAKNAVKRMISEHRHHGGGGLLNKLAQLRRR